MLTWCRVRDWEGGNNIPGAGKEGCRAREWQLAGKAKGKGCQRPKRDTQTLWSSCQFVTLYGSLVFVKHVNIHMGKVRATLSCLGLGLMRFGFLHGKRDDTINPLIVFM